MFLVFSNFDFQFLTMHHEADNTFTGFRAPVALLNITPQLWESCYPTEGKAVALNR